MTQSRTHSFMEACTNIAVGYAINIVLNYLIFRCMSIPVTLHQNLTMGLIFTGVSLTRTYVIRRAWNRRLTVTSEK